ncbi:MAG TPA: hypothetical protein V6D18_21840 [Thermosynechococcaceae cyanobacterium]
MNEQAHDAILISDLPSCRRMSDWLRSDRADPINPDPTQRS